MLLADLENYKQKARSRLVRVAGKGETIDWNKMILLGKFPHLQQIIVCVLAHDDGLIFEKERLEFLEFILIHSNLQLEIKELELLWQCVVQQALTSQERDTAFTWLERTRSVGHVSVSSYLHYLSLLRSIRLSRKKQPNMFS